MRKTIVGLVTALLVVILHSGPVAAESSVSLDSMVVWIKTADVKKAGTDANIYLSVNWKEGRQRGRGAVFLLPNLKGNDNERGDENRFAFKITNDIPLLEISGLTLINGMNNKGAGWRVEKIRIAVATRGTNRRFFWLTEGDKNYQNIDKWLDSKDANGPAEAIPFVLLPFEKQDMHIDMRVPSGRNLTGR